MRNFIAACMAAAVLAMPATASAGWTSYVYYAGYIYENTWATGAPSIGGSQVSGWYPRTFNFVGLGSTTYGKYGTSYAAEYSTTGTFYGTSVSDPVNSNKTSAVFCGRGNSGTHVLVHVECQTNKWTP
jgi:hypothetical protein